MKEFVRGILATIVTVLVAYWWASEHLRYGGRLFAVPIASFFLTLLMPDWRWLAGMASVFGAVLLIAAGQHLYLTATSDHEMSTSEAMAVGFFVLTIIGAAGGALANQGVRALWRFLQRPKRPVRMIDRY